MRNEGLPGATRSRTSVGTDDPGAAMLVRASTERDLDALRDLWRATWRDAYGSRVGPDADAVIEASLAGDAIRAMFAEDGGCFVALEGHAIVGSLCFAERGAVAYVWGMYVHPPHQRRGIGTALIRHAAQAFRSADRVDLSAVDDRARAFYRKLGFAEQGLDEVELFPEIRVPTTRLVAEVRALVPRPIQNDGPKGLILNG